MSVMNEKRMRSIIKESIQTVLVEKRQKRSLIKELYTLVHPYTTHRFQDDGWQNVRAILDVIGEWSDDISVYVENGGYGKSRDGMSSYKTWNFDLVKDGIEINGYLRANACGSMEDEWEFYDVVVIAW